MKNHLSEIILISISCICVLSFVISRIVKSLKMNRDEKQILNNCKNAKKIIRKYKLRSVACSLHIFDSLLIGESQLNRLKDGKEVVVISDEIIAVASTKGFLLIVDKNSIQEIRKFKRLLGLRFEFINTHFDISASSSADSAFMEEIYIELPCKDTKDLVVNFYTKENDFIEEFNETISTENIYKLSTTDELKHTFVNTMIGKIIKGDLSTETSYKCIKRINEIFLIINNITINYGDKVGEIYVHCLLNKEHNFYTRKASSKYYDFATPKNIVLNTITLVLSVVFLVNIVSSFKLKEVNKYDVEKNSTQKLQSLQNKFDKKILLSSIYPDAVKYRPIYTHYANFLVDSQLLPSFKSRPQTQELFTATAYLIYFIYMQDSTKDDGLQSSIKVLSSISNLSEAQLNYIAKYSDSATRDKVLEEAEQASKELYKNKNNLEGGFSFDHILSLDGFNRKYFEISDDARVKVINDIYKVYLNKCLIEKVLLQASAEYTIPPSINNIFNLYRENAKKARYACDSELIGSITEDISSALSYANSSSKKAKDFNAVMYEISNGVAELSSNNSPLKNKQAQKLSDNETKILIQHIINNIVNNSYKTEDLPLVSPVNKSLIMKFNPNFYTKKVSISPKYSTAYIEDNIVPLEKRYNDLTSEVSKGYGVNLDFLRKLYKNAHLNFNEAYIKAYDDLIMQLNTQPCFLDSISNEKAFPFYLISKSADNSQINILLDFYKGNTHIKDESFALVNEHFSVQNKFLNSKGYSHYKKAFAELNDLIKEKGYVVGTYSKLKKGYKPFEVAYKDISVLNTQKDNSLYVLLKEQLDNAELATQTIASNRVMQDLDREIETEYTYIDNFMPINLNASEVLSNDKLISDIGETGKIYTVFDERLRPMLNYDEVNNKWFNNSFKSAKQERYMAQFNKVYTLNKLLWASDGKAKPISFSITPKESQVENYKFASIFFNRDSFVNSLNVDYTTPTKILYEWTSRAPVSIIIKLDNGDTVEKSYSGNWAILKAIKDAECENDICTWTLAHKGKKYRVKFKIESSFLDVIKK